MDDPRETNTSQTHMSKGMFKPLTPQSTNKGSIIKHNKQDPNKREEACCSIY